MTDRPMIAILLALIVESAHWTKFRWEFNEEARDRAWQTTTVLIALAGVLVFLESTPYRALPNLLTWLPPLLLPMQFIQSFGLENSLPVNTFSFLPRHRRQRNLRLGLTESLVHVNFGNVYFVTTMVAATLGERAGSRAFLPGIIILTGWLLLSNNRSRPLSLVVALIVAGGLAVAGQFGIEKLEQLGGGAPSRSAFSPNGTSTLVGKPGKVEQSPEIVWRLRPENSPPPRLLRTASYNDYNEGSWRLRPYSESQFKDLATIEPVIGEIYHLLVEKPAFRADMPRFNLRGAASNESPLPLPGDTASLRDFELDGVERNSLGTVRVFPKHSVIEGVVRWKGDANPELPPFPREDLGIPKPERETLRAVVEQLRLADQPTLQAKLNVIREWFQQDFGYTRTLTISSSRHDFDSTGSKRPTAITRFLTEVKAGHCEYFATATALLLREAGIPARYTVGYAVMERDVKRGEFVIRGTHGHAW
ncbi:MAG TPA: transglutaminase-like domain-containing protein, partial [Luteolibacter sp.]